MKVAVAQLTSNNDVNQNLEQVLSLTEEAGRKKAQLITFPENSLFFRIGQEEKISALDLRGNEVLKIKEVADKVRCAVHLTTPINIDGVVYNASILIESGRDIRLIYKKIHLFDISLTGQQPVRESDYFKAGEKSSTFELGGFRFASSICYDIRFAELYSIYAQVEVDVILIPAAFLVKTGRAHWEVLARARAIESQCYVLAAAQVGTHKSSFKPDQFRETFGNSLIIDPWGEVLQKKETGVGLMFIELDRKEIEKVRKQIPMASHRKSGLF